MDRLLADRDGVNLLKEYLLENGLDHYIDFWCICNGLKLNASNYGAEQVRKIVSKTMQL